MPFRIHAFDDGRGSLVAGEGRVEQREALEAYEGYFTPEHVRRRLYVLADFRRVTELAAGSEIAQQLASLGDHVVGDNARDGVVAVVGASDLTFGMARMWQAHVEQRLSSLGWSTLATRSMDEAVEWIAAAMRVRHGLEVEAVLREQIR